MDGNLAPNAGAEWFDAPEEQVEEERVEAAIKAASFPVMSKVADWFEEQIEKTYDIRNIDLSSGLMSTDTVILAYQMLGDLLQEKYNEFKEFQEKV